MSTFFSQTNMLLMSVWSCFFGQDEEDGTETGEGDEWMQGKTLIKPLDQLDLTEAVSLL